VQVRNKKPSFGTAFSREVNSISNLGFIGIIRAQKHDAVTGELISDNHYFNTSTNFMLSAIAGWLSGMKTTTDTPPPTQIGAGNGIGTPSASDTALWSPIFGTQRDCDDIMVTRGVYAQFNITYQTTDPNGPYMEVGLFDVNNNLWAHASINEIKSDGQTLTIQWMILTVPDASNPYAMTTNYAANTITNWLAGTATTTSAPPPTQIQLGTGTGILSVSDASLWAPTAGTLKTCDYIAVSNSYNTQYSLTYTGTDPIGNFTEAGLFDSAGNLWMHAVLTDANKTAGRILGVLLQISVTQSNDE
jgi:hypothetical protein